MAWSIRSRVSSLLRSEVRVMGSLFHWDTCWRTVPFSVPTNSSSAVSSRTRPWPKFMNWARMDSCYAAASFKEKQSENKDTEAGGDHELFGLMKQRFLSFKNHKYMKELEHFQALSKAQYPKFMVIACADSRVCPSNILGFQPGEAFMIRNIANLVPLMKNGPSECNAALEFAVTTLEVENILVIGHSSCAGIENLMKIQEDVESSFINKWVTNGNVAKLRTKAATAHLSFAQQCRFCEKESINQSLLNMLSYPWIEDKVRSGLLSLHGGYYDFSSCMFEKWTLDFNGCTVNEESSSYAIKEQEFWS
ncbi:beta carbonic anhydrase 5, chloroplastic-like isoform X2 [Arachis stenosperma]|uniref:beta carbonic anhydrase 5, chloroplastic-like isoform X2 n=1 Tax=Arachis stenosperma TaxID=217475 RepID=UPI0025AD495C|nr:beta carbonic anhydrase 5, chloroplastic-like isoform X2 [Arachis stenosperma]